MNKLQYETSPYLLQHKDNPVEWYPWGDEALGLAKTQDKPILLSVGYSACHWCHVMAHESFEHDETAKLMNEWFINIKVDREERPDVDAIYMEAVQAMTGRGGWPMTVFLMPDGRPFYGGTYFPLERRYGMPSFRDVLLGVHDAYLNRLDEVNRVADNLTES
ncbi:MAG TPA: thioredoxin domain-containing protein, partial [Aggregatilineales bacterium]|nr:thioredoxin domain-containing protein [Aggregatilineales bacterium]